MKSIKTIINKDKLFVVKWRLTEWCNYSCSYCLRMNKDKPHKGEREGMVHRDRFADENMAIACAPEINRIINEVAVPTKINLIGGEVTFFDLKKIISLIDSKYLKRVNITTNFSNSLEYYVDFAKYLHSRGVSLSISISFHDEYTDIEKFAKKVYDFKEATKDLDVYNLKIEFVIAKSNVHLVDAVKEQCSKYDIDYLMEIDKTSDLDFKNKMQPYNTAQLKASRYHIYFDNGEKSEDYTRNHLITHKICEHQFEKTHFLTKIDDKDFYCTSGISYIYINKTIVFENSSCVKKGTFIRDYHIPPIEERKLRKCTSNGCNLCGGISLSYDKEFLENYCREVGFL